ncbi:MAG: PEGA domain-containing protein, partial [Spirochaetales bacterium]|nr:PEGA domain-containing protein [Spirochaetales bacterium]
GDISSGNTASVVTPIVAVSLQETPSSEPEKVMDSADTDVAALPAATGIYIDTVPAQATVVVDGVAASGMTPLSLDLSSGHHSLLVSMEGYYDVPVDVDVADGDMVPLSISLYRK